MRQLSLFKGKRQRGTLPPPPLEFATQCFLADVIRRDLNPAWRFTHLPFGEKREPATAVRLKRMGVTPGWFDFMFVGPKATVFFLELKRRGGRLSDAQLEMVEHLNACGIDYLVTHDVRSAILVLTTLGILRGKVRVQ